VYSFGTTSEERHGEGLAKSNYIDSVTGSTQLPGAAETDTIFKFKRRSDRYVDDNEDDRRN